MYEKSLSSQPEFPNFYMPFGGKLNPENRWVILRKLVPWDEVEQHYASNFSSRGPKALTSQVALGSLIIKERLNVSDRETVEQIRENPYLQYFIGFDEFCDELPFNSSSMVHFRKRFTLETLQDINEKMCLDQSTNEEEIPRDDDSENPPNQGKLIVDATCTPADITYPTDVKLLNDCREKTEEIIDKLHALRQGKKKPRTYREKARKDFLNFIKAKKPSRSKRRAAIRKQLSYVQRNLAYIEQLKEEVGFAILGRPLHRKLLVINEIYRQQKDMYDRKSHTISDRIVSLAQPHVRPIVRGKAGKKYEFGAKISLSLCNGFSFVDHFSWNAYNESEDLIGQIETYKRRFGHYPESVHADQIYRNQRNRKYCKERSIRIFGKPLGRPPKDKKKCKAIQKQTRQDEADRVAVEGKIGQSKRRFSLSRVMAKLASTSEAVVGLVFLIINLEKKLIEAFWQTLFIWIKYLKTKKLYRIDESC